MGSIITDHRDAKMIPIVVEERMRDTLKWRGKGAAALGGKL